MNGTRRRRAGFTLIEVLLVLVILVVLGSIAGSQFFGAEKTANKNAAKVQVDMFAKSINVYRIACRELPRDLEGLIKKPSDGDLAERWDGPYLDKGALPDDPWGNEYRYAAEGKRNPGSFDVWSVGPDGQDGNDDDIGNWAP